MMDPVYLTAGQCKYLAGLEGFAGESGPAPPSDLVITDKSENGWIFVENAKHVGEEGSGVWVDVNGDEQYGSTGAKSEPMADAL